MAAWNVPRDGIVPALIILSACFLAGGLAGCLLAAQVGGAGEASLNQYLEAFLLAAQEGAVDVPALWAQIWDTLRWPLFALLLGFTALGVLGLPVLFTLRGFLLAFSIASFVRAFGGAGWLLACLVFGIGGVLSLPALFVLGVQSILSARALAARVRGEGKGQGSVGPGLSGPMRAVSGRGLCVYSAGADRGARSVVRRRGRSFEPIERETGRCWLDGISQWL